MPRYINADNLEYEILHTDFEVVKHECKDYESYVNGANCFRSKAKNLINNTPTEDVVPRAEVEEWKAIAETYQKMFEDSYEAKQEVAREIFDLIDNYIYIVKTTVSFDLEFLITSITELKKKYIGE